MSQAEAKSYEKTFDRPVSRKPAGKRIGKSFDKDAKFSKGDQKARPTKLFKNYERPLGENEKQELLCRNADSINWPKKHQKKAFG